jgi:hypothetical protein
MSARPGPGGGYHAEWYPYRDHPQSLQSGKYNHGARAICPIPLLHFHENENTSDGLAVFPELAMTKNEENAFPVLTRPS